MKIEKIVKPCRNFCFLGSELITDPRDGKEKFVLSTFAGEGGSLVFIDTETGEGESISLPADSGAWALYNYNNERLLVGTCASYGYLHCLELKTRTWLKSLRCEGETYIWNLTMGSDGNIYGGTYPGCVLLRYDPRRHELVNLGKADNGKNLYWAQVDLRFEYEVVSVPDEDYIKRVHNEIEVDEGDPHITWLSEVREVELAVGIVAFVAPRGD